MLKKSFILTGNVPVIIFIVLAMVLFSFHSSYGRNGLKLYSITNNSPWNSPATWSFSAKGPASGILPESNDTVIIDCTVIQNVNFNFLGAGALIISSTGLLRGDNLNLGFSENTSLICFGELKINTISFVDNSTCFINDKGKITVNNSYTNSSLITHFVNGSLIVSGELSVGQSSRIYGKGLISSLTYSGKGSIFNINSTSSIPIGSSVSENNFLGIQNSDWNNPANWSGGVVPGSETNISIIATTQITDVLHETFCNNLYINSGSSLIVLPSAVLNIAGNLSVSGTGKLILKNTVSSKSSLILKGNATGKIQSEYPVVSGKNQLVSAPFSNVLSGTFVNMYLRTYDEASSQWNMYIVPTDTPLQNMRGYELLSLNSETRIFEGTPDESEKSFQITNSGNGLNLAGNPYPTYIDWENDGAWQRASIASAIYYPDPSGSGNYAVYLPGGDDAISLNNGSRYIPPMQGFFIKAVNPGLLKVNSNSCIGEFSDTKPALKNNSIKFQLGTDGHIDDEALLRVNSISTSGFDTEFDALKLDGNASASIYFPSTDENKYAINTIPFVNSSSIISLNFNCEKSGNFTIFVSGCSNFEFGNSIFLEDKILNKFVDLRIDSVYSFTQISGISQERFVIHFKSPLGIDEQGDSQTQVITNSGEVFIKGKGNGIYTASLYSIDGKLINSTKGILSEGIKLNTNNQPSGVCILKLIDSNHNAIMKKIFTK